MPSSGTAAAPRSDYEQSSDVTDDNTVIDFSDGTAPSTNSSAASAAAPTPAAPTVAAAVPTAEPDKEDEAPPLMQGSAGSGTYDNDELPSYAQSPYYEGGTYGYYEASDLADLKASAAYELNAPSYMPDSYSADAYALISGSLAQIRYFNGTDEILYRTEPGTEDCSGNYSVYDTEKEIKVNDITVTLKINNTSGFLATWQKDNMVYSLDGTGSVSEAEITRIISSICPVA